VRRLPEFGSCDVLGFLLLNNCKERSFEGGRGSIPQVLLWERKGYTCGGDAGKGRRTDVEVELGVY